MLIRESWDLQIWWLAFGNFGILGCAPLGSWGSQIPKSAIPQFHKSPTPQIAKSKNPHIPKCSNPQIAESLNPNSPHTTSPKYQDPQTAKMPCSSDLQTKNRTILNYLNSKIPTPKQNMSRFGNVVGNVKVQLQKNSFHHIMKNTFYCEDGWPFRHTVSSSFVWK